MSVVEVVAAAAAPPQQKLLLPRWVTTTVVGVISLQLIVRASCALYRRRLMVAQSDALRVNHSSPKSSDAVVVQGGSAPASSDNSAHEGLAGIGALCDVVVKHMAEVQGDALHRDEMGRGEEVVDWRAWALATEAACLHGLDVKKDESSNIYRGSFHAVDDEILELVRDARFLLSAPITTPSAVGYRCLLLIARRERLLRIRAAIEVLRDARQSADALESWVELHDTVGLRSLHEAWPSTSHPEQTPMSDVIHRLQTIWELQQRQHAALLAQHRRLRWAGSVTLVRLIVAASPVKIALLLSAGVCGLVIAWLSGKGNAIRDLCEQQTAEFLVAGHAQWNPTVMRDFAVRLCPLVGKELIRILAEQFLNTYLVTQIKLWSARQREVMKMQTLRCLIDQPLSFYHIYGQDEIDEIVLYVNDIEGVDVHVHQFLLKIQLSVLKLHDTARKASWFILIAAACGVAMHQATIVTCEVLRVGWRMLTMAAFRTYTDKPIDDLEELENAASGTRQVLLGGGAIISEVHRLRPHDADHRLMERWCDSMTSAAEQFRHGNVRRVVGDARMPRNGWMRLFVSSSISIVDGLPDTVDSALASIPAFVRWVIPMALACCVTPFVSSRMAPKWAAKTTKGVRGVTVISDTMTLVEAVVTATVDVVRIYDLIIANGHKALMVQRFMKRAEREKERRLATTVDRRVVDDVLSGITPIRAIHFRDVNFVYPRPQAFTTFAYESGETSQSQLVLNRLNVSLTDLPGKLVCITGPSGCGKSTMLNLLLGLYRSSDENVELSGNIMLEIESQHHHHGEGQAVVTTDETTSSPPHDVVSLESLSSSTIRGVGGIFGFVPQQASVFPGTIAQNVALLQSVSLSTDQNELQRVKKACEQANCMNYITKLSDGVMSYVVPPSSSGASSAAGLQATSTVLSVGQAQRLMIARALYQGCCILLMDEPTSALDQSTKAALLKDLKSALKQPGQLQTIIAVTHDEAVVAAADVVVVVG